MRPHFPRVGELFFNPNRCSMVLGLITRTEDMPHFLEEIRLSLS
jgi:hypothetical protein